MKKLLTILLSVISLTVMAQVPQGVGYQGVATDANGIELVNQSISIRASVLSGSATGTIEWEETHATSTDTFGLFTLTIGQGTSTTNGAQSTFADISWGTNTHFLKIEMDVTGGSTYSNMGTNQMMSVPYALYAESANINYDSISNLLSNDSTFITNVGGGMGGGGCDIQYPDGLDGDPITYDLSSSYTVPAGKNLYITNLYSISGFFSIDGVNVHGYYSNYNNGPKTAMPFIAKEGQVLLHSSSAGSFNGYLVDALVDPITYDLSSSYTVPTGKNLYITNLYSISGFFSIDGVNLHGYYSNYNNGPKTAMPFIAKQGQVLLHSTSAGSFNGYLVDENYFAACGGGGSSTTSSLDSTTIANMIAGAGGGCNFKYPDGLDGDPITIDLSSSGYTVPTGKNLYILQAYKIGGAPVIHINQNINGTWVVGPPAFSVSGGALDEYDGAFIAKSGVNINAMSGMGSVLTISGILVDKVVDPITVNLLTSSYTVPNGKNLYILQSYNVGQDPVISINGLKVFQCYSGSLDQNDGVFIAKSGDIIEMVAGYNPSVLTISGYLADENYFAACGGGGSSSTSSLDSTTIANMIAAAGGGCDFKYPEGRNGDLVQFEVNSVNPYTVPPGKRLYVTNLATSAIMLGLFVNGGPVAIGNGGNIGPDVPIILNSGDILTNSSNSTFTYVYGFLVNESNSITAITTTLTNSVTYQVPAGKKLHIISISNLANSSELIYINGGPYISGAFGGFLITKSGDVLSGWPNTQTRFNGYLVDENYFAACGGGGPSSTSTAILPTLLQPDGINGYSRLDTNLVSGFNGDCCPGYYGGSCISSYTVPAGKNLYITDIIYGVDFVNVNNCPPISLKINGVIVHSYYSGGTWGTNTWTPDLTLIASEGDILTAELGGWGAHHSNASNQISITAFLVDKIVDGIVLTANYTVPISKNLVLFNNTSYPEVYGSGTVVTVSSNRYGYLIDN